MGNSFGWVADGDAAEGRKFQRRVQFLARLVRVSRGDVEITGAPILDLP
jgi:hypothetical protein